MVEEARQHRSGAQEGVHINNLFLRNKKKKMSLVVAREDLCRFKGAWGCHWARRVSFGSPDRLDQYIGVKPSAVTPFAAVNDAEDEVEVVLG